MTRVAMPVLVGVAAPLLRSLSASRPGGAPNIRAYSRLNCEALS